MVKEIHVSKELSFDLSGKLADTSAFCIVYETKSGRFWTIS